MIKQLYQVARINSILGSSKHIKIARDNCYRGQERSWFYLIYKHFLGFYKDSKCYFDHRPIGQDMFDLDNDPDKNAYAYDDCRYEKEELIERLKEKIEELKGIDH